MRLIVTQVKEENRMREKSEKYNKFDCGMRKGK